MNRKQRMKNRANCANLNRFIANKTPCPNCGKPGAHYAPPGYVGPEGMYLCDNINLLYKGASTETNAIETPV